MIVEVMLCSSCGVDKIIVRDERLNENKNVVIVVLGEFLMIMNN